MGDYFAHWLRIGEVADQSKLPRIFFVNWFRKDQNGKFIWPGYGDNMRVLKWIVERCEGKVGAKDTPIGLMPRYEDMDLEGLNVSREAYDKLTSFDRGAWREEVQDHDKFFERLRSRLPSELDAKREELAQAIG
jgi:phosphoenolpyruvate carboxykinase (GTP)